VPASGRRVDVDRAALRSWAATRRARIRNRRLVLLGGAVLIAVAVLYSTGGPDRGRNTSDTTHAVDPSYFATGSCTYLPPTHGNRHKTVFLDAGHGGPDPGGTGQTESGVAISEAPLNLSIELDAADVLRADGFSVVVSRTANTSVLRLTSADVSGNEFTLLGSHDDAAARDVCANKAHASLLVGIYLDSSSTPDTAGSLTGYDADRPFSNNNVRFAQLLQADVLAAMNAKGWQIPDDGVTDDSALGSVPAADNPDSGLAAEAAAYDHLLLLGPAEAGYFTTPSRMPGALIEPLYLSDPFEGSIADSTLGQKAIGGGIAKAVEAYFAPPKSGTGPSATTPLGTTAGA
jgi:N-acetylmuramoyl-L-alanine amidase